MFIPSVHDSSRYNVNPLVRKHLHLRNAFVTSVLNIQLSCLAITFIVLVMQATQTPLELAMAAYEAQQHIPEEDRSSLRTVATDYGVLPGTSQNGFEGLLRLDLKPTTTYRLCPTMRRPP